MVRQPSSGSLVYNQPASFMRHQKKTIRLGRTAEHRKALLANQVCSLIEHERIKTTLAKAKAVRPVAERMVTLGKNGSLHARRTAFAVLRQKTAVKKLFDNIAPRSTDRNGGYTRIIKLGQRKSDSAPIAFIEWVDAAQTIEEKEPKTKEKTPKAKKETAPAAKESRVAAKETEPAEKETQPPAPKEEAAPAPTEEPKPKKRRWFGKRSGETK
jgi:large subunit ribosomal protein L17